MFDQQEDVIRKLACYPRACDGALELEGLSIGHRAKVDDGESHNR
jgi:hypothetical protein